MAKYDDSLRVEIDIITKNIRPKVQEIVGSLKEIGKEADKAKEKLASLDKAGASHSSSEYKEAEAELRKFTDAYVLGGAGKEGNFYMVYLYEEAFGHYRMGYATALAWVLFVIILLLTFVVNWTKKYWVYSE